ncbi:MAG: NADH-ubiquinone oxidoreductase-F iron-sulfur binding region domain-containing protein [Candidatus Sedimenticola sp. 6PFRAG7]
MSEKPLNQVLLHPENRVGPNLEKWLSGIGGEGLTEATRAPSAIISLVKEAGLRGLGGSGFPSYKKWEFVAAQQREGDKYLICNGNEDEPGTFKDRLLMAETPHQVIEGAVITALGCGINKIVFYINPDLAEAIDNMHMAVGQWQDSDQIQSASEALGKPMELKVVRSSGHYIGGEETAAIESVEGNFPFPRGKPPYPAENGVYGCPTLINNVETLANVSHILRNGAQWYRNLGAGDACGTKVYCISGDVLRPGAYELPMGTPLSELLYIYGDGMLVGKKLKAIFTGGPSNTILTPKDLDVPLDFESVAARRSALGTGAMIVVSHGTGIVKRVAEYVNFFAASSCGQCPSCKTGTYYMSLLLSKIDTGQGTRADLDSLISLCKIIPGSGRCHLPDGAVKVVDSSLYHFMNEYEQSLL